jgi:SAM-dependent methyltransferase
MKKVINFFTFLLGRVKKNRRVNVNTDSEVKVNLGCGLAVYGDWVNIDGSLNALVSSLPYWALRYVYKYSGANAYYSLDEYSTLLKSHTFIHHDISYNIPLEDGVVDYIFSSHFVEHLFKDEALNLLREIKRVLKPGGIVRISIPDLEYAVGQYLSGNKDKMLLDYFFVEDKNSFYARHKYMYDFQMMQDILNELGFVGIERKKYREGKVPDLDFLDNRPADSLFIEARVI